MDKINELRALIKELVEKIDDEKVLRRIYAFVNRLFVRR